MPAKIMACPHPQDIEDAGTVFPFFKLPRDLRDMIYHGALGQYTALPHKFIECNLLVSVKNSAKLNLLLVNKQFHAEYMERAKQVACLVFKDVTRDDPRACSTLSDMKYIRHLDFHICITNDDHDGSILSAPQHTCFYQSEINLHQRWISGLLHQPDRIGSTFAISVYIHTSLAMAAELQCHKGPFNRPRGMASLDVCYACMDEYTGDADLQGDYFQDKRLVMRYNPNSGELEEASDSGRHDETTSDLPEASQSSETAELSSGNESGNGEPGL